MTGSEFRRQRRSLDLTQLDVAKISGIDHSTICRFERYSIALKEEQLQRLTSALRHNKLGRAVATNADQGARP